MLLQNVTQAFCIVLNLIPKSMYVAWECSWLSDIGIEHELPCTEGGVGRVWGSGGEARAVSVTLTSWS